MKKVHWRPEAEDGGRASEEGDGQAGAQGGAQMGRWEATSGTRATPYGAMTEMLCIGCGKQWPGRERDDRWRERQ